MGLFSRKTLTWCLVAFFVTISLARGVHYHPLFGFHGSDGCCASSSDCDLSLAGSADHHARHTGGCAWHHHDEHADDASLPASKPTPNRYDDGLSTPAIALDGHHCPVCQFFAQGQLLPDAVSAAGVFASPERPAATLSTIPLSARSAYGARGPPAVI